MVDGLPVVTWEPKLSAGEESRRSYTIYGKTNLTDKTWHSPFSQEALKITAKLNGQYHTPDEVRQMMAELTASEIDESFGMFPPFHTDMHPRHRRRVARNRVAIEPRSGRKRLRGKNIKIGNSPRYEPPPATIPRSRERDVGNGPRKNYRAQQSHAQPK